MLVIINNGYNFEMENLKALCTFTHRQGYSNFQRGINTEKNNVLAIVITDTKNYGILFYTVVPLLEGLFHSTVRGLRVTDYKF